uniref:F-actin-capping protein subunit alpha n=1 Tax=Gongylonema pulchrum TaxID=637853 RepID=A0A183F178_9BILA
LMKVEIPQNIYICQEAWTAASDLLTEALKLKRKNIEKQYKMEINAMYEMQHS